MRCILVNALLQPLLAFLVCGTGPIAFFAVLLYVFSALQPLLRYKRPFYCPSPMILINMLGVSPPQTPQAAYLVCCLPPGLLGGHRQVLLLIFVTQKTLFMRFLLLLAL